MPIDREPALSDVVVEKSPEGWAMIRDLTEREKLVEEMVIAATGEYPSRWISSISMSAALTVAEAAFARREDELQRALDTERDRTAAANAAANQLYRANRELQAQLASVRSDEAATEGSRS